MNAARRLFALPSIVLLAACGVGVAEDTESPPALSTADLTAGPWAEEVRPLPRAGMRGFSEAADQAERLTGRVAQEAGPANVRGLLVHRVVLDDASGARFAVAFAEETGAVVQVEGVAPPFDGLRLSPSGGFLSLEAALDAATDGQPSGVLAWTLGLDAEANWTYAVRFVTPAGIARTVRLDARSGEPRADDA